MFWTQRWAPKFNWPLDRAIISPPLIRTFHYSYEPENELQLRDMQLLAISITA